MCLAIPVKIVKIDGDVGMGEVGGVNREVNLSFIEDLRVGDYVLLHAGFAIQKIDEEEAQKTIQVFREISEVY